MPLQTNEDECRVYSRRIKVAAIVLRGVTNQFDILAQLGMGDDTPANRCTISRDLKAIKEEWRVRACEDWREAQGAELARLDALEREYWAAWERSKVDRESHRDQKTRRGDYDQETTETKKEPRDGDPRFLDGILNCIKRRCAILGLDAEKPQSPVVVNVQTEAAAALNRASTDDLRALRDLRRKLVADAGPGPGPSAGGAQPG